MNAAKRKLLLRWLKKARNDIKAAQLLARELPDIGIYHCQQAVEKSIKALLILYDIEPDKTHNIDALLQQAARINPKFRADLIFSVRLTEYNYVYRYPEEGDDEFEPTPGEMAKAYRTAATAFDLIVALMPKQLFI